MFKVEKINILAILGVIASWGTLLYYSIHPEKYENQIIHLEHSSRRINAKLYYDILHFAHNMIGKSGVYILLFIIGLLCMYYSVRFHKKNQ